MKPRLFFAKLRIRNQIHHGKAVNAIGHKFALKRLAISRAVHIKKLQKNDLFKKIFKHTITFTNKIEKRKTDYIVLGTGAKKVKLAIQNSDFGLQPHNVCFVMDPLGRVRFFAKPTTIGNSSWTEVRGFLTTYRLNLNKKTNTREREYYLKTKESGNMSLKETEVISSALPQIESKLNFDPSITIQDIQKIKKYL